MLSDTLRDGANSKGFKILLALIVISFIISGVGGYLIPRLNTDPVTIGEYKITSNEWTEQYNRRAQQLHQYGPQAAQLLENQAYVVELKKSVLESMIDNVAFNSQVWESGVRIGDAQVRDVIRNTPAFQKDGKFDNDLYLATVRNMGLSPDYFGEQMRLSMMSESISRPVMAAAGLPLPYEIKNVASLLGERRTVNLYTVDQAAVRAATTISDADAQAYYDSHHDEFIAPANVRFNYLLLSFNDLKEQIEVTDAALEEYYNLYSADFERDETRAVSHLLIRANSENAAERVAAVEQGLKDGTDFKDLIAQYSDDSASKAQGGSMGVIARGQLAANLDQVAFSLAQGQVSTKIEDSFGTHFIKVDEIIAPHTPTLDEIKDEVRTAYVNAEARNLYNERATTMSDLSFENPDSLDITAEAIQLKVQDSSFVIQGDANAKWPFNNPELQNVAFNPDVYSSGINSQVISLDQDNSIVINVLEHHEAELRPFAEVKDSALAAAQTQKINETCHGILQTFAQNLQSDANAALPEHVSVQSEVEVAIGTSNVAPAFGQAIFALPQDATRAYTIDDNNGVQTLVVLTKVTAPSESELSGLEQVLSAQYGQYLNLITQRGLYREARALSEIEYNEEAINLVTRQSE